MVQPNTREEWRWFKLKIEELNQDQKKVILVLRNPEDFFRGFHTTATVRGVPYKKIIEKTELSMEKVLLSLGWLEASGFIDHDVAVIRKTLDYLGQTNIEIAGQSVVRMFYLTDLGKKALKSFEEQGEE